MGKPKIQLAGPMDLDRIDSYVQNSTSTNLYHDFRWGSVVENVFGHEYRLLFSTDRTGTVDGILPLVHMRSYGFGNMMVSMPFFNYGGVCSEREGTRELLIEEAVRIAVEKRASHIELRQENPLDNGFPSKSHKVSMRLDLPSSAEELWKTFPSKLRSQIRVPQKAGFDVRFGRDEELDSFYRVFCVNMKYLGTPVYPKGFFREILRQFPKSTWICTVYRESLPVATGFLAGFKDRIEIPWASSLRKYNRLSPNMLLYWSCLEFACGNGFALFDFGRSTPGESTYKFKEQWGATPTPLRWSYWVRDRGDIPDLSPRNPKYHLAISVWKRLPLPVTRILGPRIIRNIP